MAALAQHRTAHRKHARVIRAVRVVAVAAILGDRCMFPEIRAALFGMAVEAGVVQRLLGKLPLARITVSAVTAAAVHFTLAYRMRIGLQRLRALLLMALKANFGLRRGHQDRITGRVAGMTVGTRNVVHVVIVAVPTKASVRIVAAEAGSILKLHRTR